MKSLINKCNICDGKVKIFNPTDIYGIGYKHFNDDKNKLGKEISYIYKCLSCGGTVGCHNDTNKPLGIIADKETKKARNYCHRLLDPLWQKEQGGDYKSGSRGERRKELYKHISKEMGIDYKDMHFGMFNIEQCRDAYLIILKIKKGLQI